MSSTSYRQELGMVLRGPGRSLALTGSLGLISWEVAPANWHSTVQPVPKHAVGTFCCCFLLLLAHALSRVLPTAVCRLVGVWCNPVTSSGTPGDKEGPEDGEQHKGHPKIQRDRQQAPPCVCLPAQPSTSSQVPPVPVAQLRTSKDI